MNRASHRHQSGFTLVEMLITIAIISILLGVLLVAITGARGQGYKIVEKNNIRQAGNAWLKYAQVHRGRLTPGWLSVAAQKEWEVDWIYPDGTTIPPAPSFDTTMPNVAGPWTWRLLPYMENEFGLLRAHLDADAVNHWTEPNDVLGMEIADTPGFGLNGYFLGGCWDRWYGHFSKTHPRFVSAHNSEGAKVNLPVRSLAMIRAPSTIVAFVSTASGEPGTTFAPRQRPPGGFLATPHRLAQLPQWTITAAGDVQLVDGVTAPYGRHGGLPVTWHPDGHVESISAEKLLDQRRWIDQAEALPGYDAAQYQYEE